MHPFLCPVEEEQLQLCQRHHHPTLTSLFHTNHLLLEALSNRHSNSFANSETSNSENFSTANPLNSWRDAPSALTPSPNYARFTVHAKSNLWLLIQDPSGNELDWLKLQAGEKVPISHIGALTLTCSSGKEIDIFNKAGKKMDLPGLDKPGISIIRLN